MLVQGARFVVCLIEDGDTTHSRFTRGTRDRQSGSKLGCIRQDIIFSLNR
jgi:hypothetical protein